MDGNKVRELREAKGITQTELAAMCGITQTMISKIEVGESNGSVTVVKKIADVLGVTTDELLADKSDCD